MGRRVDTRRGLHFCLSVLLAGCASETVPSWDIELTFDQPRFDLWFFDSGCCYLLPGDHIDLEWGQFPSDDPATGPRRQLEEWVRDVAPDGLSARFLPRLGLCQDVLLIDRERQEQTAVSAIYFQEVEQRFIPSHFDLPADVWAPVYDSRTLR